MSLPDTSVPARDPVGPESVDQLFRRTARRFREAGIGTPELDARVLLCAACDITHEALIGVPARIVALAEAMRMEDYAVRRLRGEPVSRILGTREFRGLDFALNASTLDPRPDTEVLVEAALEIAGEIASQGAPLRILDLGTGSGCIIVSLLHELTDATGVACDLDPLALAAARTNAQTHGVSDRLQLFCGDWGDALDARFDLIVSNPPYIRSADIVSLAPEVAVFDPRLALDGWDDGLRCYRAIATSLEGLLREGGWALFEGGEGQSEEIAGIVTAALSKRKEPDVRFWKDLSGRSRCTGICHASSPV